MTFRDPVKKPQPQKPGTPAPIPVRVSGNVSTTTTSSALPANAAQETGGNLDAQTLALKALADLVEINARIFATLEAIRLQLGSMADNVIDPNDVADIAMVH